MVGLGETASLSTCCCEMDVAAVEVVRALLEPEVGLLAGLLVGKKAPLVGIFCLSSVRLLVEKLVGQLLIPRQDPPQEGQPDGFFFGHSFHV